MKTHLLKAWGIVRQHWRGYLTINLAFYGLVLVFMAVVAMLAAYQQGVAFLCPHTVGLETCGDGYLLGLKRTGSLYLLVVLLLAVAAVYEALEVIYLGPVLGRP